MPFDDGSFTDWFARSTLLGFVAVCFSILTTLYSMIMIGSCMCFEACIDDLIENLRDIGSKWSNENRFDKDLFEMVEYQNECTM